MRRILYLALLVTLCACNMFELRDSEEPQKPAKWNEPCVTWDQCYDNLVYAYENFQNWDKYESQFTDVFRFHFAAQDINDYNINQIWGKANERDALYNLHNLADNMVLTLEPVSQSDEIGEYEVKIYRSYVLQVIRNAVETQYRGNLELHFRKQNGIWKIQTWYDYRNSQNPTWGKLKYDMLI
ncbi:MAG: hypothetical protein U1C33_08690 [Candidatus Cloacimonadaceae bacterium]|nr:hypothetical protein [Candidatus Cloacimonadaceae bacterium]